MMQTQDDSALDDIVPVEVLQEHLLAVWHWFLQAILNLDIALQIGLIAAAIIPALMFGPRLRRLVEHHTSTRIRSGLARRLLSAALALATPLALLMVLATIRIVLGSLERPYGLIDAAMSLMSAWLVVRAVTLIIRSRFWSSVAFYIIWPVAALDVFGLLDDVVIQLQALAIPLGETAEGAPVDLSLFDILRTVIYFAALFWLASLAGRAVNAQLEKAEEISPAFRALIAKVLGFVLPVAALLIALQLTGFNIATLAIFSGAVGIGVGLGLQKTVANFAVEGVINWSKSDRAVRVHAPFGVSYGTDDIEQVQRVAIEAAQSVERVIADKTPVCNLMAYGASSVDFDLRFWITDPENGLSNVRSAVNVALWKAFHAHGIEFPFPQLDIHVKELRRSPASAGIAPPE